MPLITDTEPLAEDPNFWPEEHRLHKRFQRWRHRVVDFGALLLLAVAIYLAYAVVTSYIDMHARTIDAEERAAGCYGPTPSSKEWRS